MTPSPLMYGLIKLHRKLDGEIRRSKKNLSHVRAVIEIVSPGFDVSSIQPKKAYGANPWFQRGEMFLGALDVLREAETPLSQTEIVRRMLAKRGVTSPTTAQLRDIRNAIHATLPRYEGTAINSTGKREGRLDGRDLKRLTFNECSELANGLGICWTRRWQRNRLIRL